MRESVVLWTERPGAAHSARNPGQNLSGMPSRLRSMNHIELFRPGGL